MAERYTKVFSLGENIYTETCPIIIEAGALLKDNANNSLIGQLKFKNIDSRAVKAITVSLVLKDSAERLIGETVEYKYLDFNAGRDAELGQKTPVPISNNESRAFDVSIKEVVFANNEVWSSPENASWADIPKQQPLSSKIADSELRKQFRLDINSKAEYAYLSSDDLWFCCCGGINRINEENCHSCGKSEESSKEIDFDGLKISSKARLAKNKAEQETKEKAYKERKEKEAQQKARKKAQTIKIVTIAGATMAFVGIILLITKVIIPFAQYSSAVKLMNNGEYEVAIAKFTELDGYKDSVNYIDNCNYNSAVELMNNGEYEAAIEKFTELDGYNDSQNQINKCHSLIIEQKYNAAKELMNNGQYQEAKDIFITLDGYKDSDKLSTAAAVAHLKNVYYGYIVTFGNYKGNTEWIVLDFDKENEKILVLSKDIIAQRPYNAEWAPATWESCTLRDWLNGEYLSSAFSSDEQARILPTKVDNSDYTFSGEYYDGGENTIDKIFLLSMEEAKKYEHLLEPVFSGDRLVDWWLRSSAYFEIGGAFHTSGCSDDYGLIRNETPEIGVRPAMWIDTSDL